MNRWLFDEHRERKWQREIRECLILECLERPEKWAPIVKRWRQKNRPGIDLLVAEIRERWSEKNERA